MCLQEGKKILEGKKKKKNINLVQTREEISGSYPIP